MLICFRNMLNLLDKMFGSHFWNNVILEATHWKYTKDGIRVRLINEETEETWKKKFNDLIQNKYNITIDIPAVFINTHYDEDDKICDSGETCRVKHKQSGKFKVVKLQESRLFKKSQ